MNVRRTILCVFLAIVLFAECYEGGAQAQSFDINNTYEYINLNNFIERDLSNAIESDNPPYQELIYTYSMLFNKLNYRSDALYGKVEKFYKEIYIQSNKYSVIKKTVKPYAIKIRNAKDKLKENIRNVNDLYRSKMINTNDKSKFINKHIQTYKRNHKKIIQARETSLKYALSKMYNEWLFSRLYERLAEIEEKNDNLVDTLNTLAQDLLIIIKYKYENSGL